MKLTRVLGLFVESKTICYKVVEVQHVQDFSTAIHTTVSQLEDETLDFFKSLEGSEATADLRVFR